MTKPVDETLAERGQHYGDFAVTFGVIQKIKDALKSAPGWADMPLERREALEMIAVKMGRLVSGDSGHADSWHDIAGYARLVEESIDVPQSGVPAVNKCMMTEQSMSALEIEMLPKVSERIMQTASGMHRRDFSRWKAGVRLGNSPCGDFLKIMMAREEFITKMPTENVLMNRIFEAMESHGLSEGFISAFGYAENVEQVLIDIEDACGLYADGSDAYEKKIAGAKSWIRPQALHMALIVAVPYLRLFAQWVTLQSLDQERRRVK